jgi:phosphatidylglycerophosphatase A
VSIRFLSRDMPWLTVGGLGKLRPAPGTWGSMPPVIVAAALVAAGLGPHQAPWIYNGAMIAIALVFSLACVLQGGRAELFLGKDPSYVVADETAGQCLALLAIPAAAFESPGLAAFTLVFCFLAFRITDIVKLWPANELQRLPAGWGILVDDLIAGLQALLIVQGLTRWIL